MVHVAPAPVGKQYGPYELVRHIATGGTSSIYVAQRLDESGFEKIVALKLIHPYLAQQDEFVEMFLNEARIAAKISHANVCPVFDFGRHGEHYYLAMEYILGESLARVFETVNKHPEVRQSKAFDSIVATILADVCEGLHAAHELRDWSGKLMGVVHRDVSPSNIFVSYNGAVRVSDFGFAKSASKIHQTQPGMLMGTFAYMSPEQVNGQSVDRRADLWAVGVVAWELLTGKRLFERKNLHQTFEDITQGAIPDLSTLRPETPLALVEVVRRCLSRAPQDRPESARLLSQDLRRFVVECGMPVGPAEISAWMQGLFPTGLQDRRGLVEVNEERAPERVRVTATRHQRRSTRRWAFVGLAAAGVLAYLAYTLARGL